MSAYRQGYAAKIKSDRRILTSVGTITPAQLTRYEPLMAGGELVLAGPGPDYDIVMGEKEVINFSVSITTTES